MKRICPLILLLLMSQLLLAQATQTPTDYLQPVQLPVAKEKRQLHDSAWTQLVNDDAFHYRMPEEIQQQNQGTSWYYRLFRQVFLFFQSGLGKLLLWCIVGAFVLYIVLRMLRLNGNPFFLKKNKKLPPWESETELELLPEDWEKAMEEAVRKDNFRLAIRYAYRYLIHLMRSRNLIQYEAAKTNDQYVHELAATSWYQPFLQMTRKYERVWYGGFEVKRPEFEAYNAQLNELKYRLDEMPGGYVHADNHRAVPMLLLLVMLNWGCSSPNQTDWTIRLSRENKNPYGLYLCYNSLNDMFPQAAVETLSPSYNLSRLSTRLKNDPEHSALIFIGESFQVTDKEAEDLLSLTAEGHQVMIAARDVSQNLMHLLHTGKRTPELNSDEVKQCIVIAEDTSVSEFCYKGHNILSFFTAMNGNEKQYTALGQTKDKGDNFVAFSIGKGRLLLHAAPLAFSNYFLLQQQNRFYLPAVFQYVLHPKRVLWMDFGYRAAAHYGNWSILWRHPATRGFLIIALITLILYVLFEMKRKQQIIPIVHPPLNASAAFVQTIGRLYYNTGNHNNLAEKMVQHFLEQLRSKFYVNTNLPDSAFAAALMAKSGWPEDEVQRLLQQIRQVQSGLTVDEKFLMNLYAAIQKFLNHDNGTI